MPVTFTTKLASTPDPSFDTTTEDKIVVSWSDVTDTGHYDLEWKRASLSSWYASIELGGDATSYTIDPSASYTEFGSADPTNQEETVSASFTTGSEHLAYKATKIEFEVENTGSADTESSVHVGLQDSGGNLIWGVNDTATVPGNDHYVFQFDFKNIVLDPNSTYTFYAEEVDVDNTVYADTIDGYWEEDLLDGEPYDVRLRVQTEDVDGDWVRETPATFLPAPTSFSASNIGQFGADFSWQDNADNETGFYLQRRRKYEDGWGPWRTAKDLSAGTTSATDDTALPGEIYEYRVQVYTQ